MYLHIFFFDPVTILLEDLAEFGICPLEEDHQNIEASEETEGWLTRLDDLTQRTMTREWGLLPNITVTVGAEDTRISYGDNNLGFHLLWVEKNYRLRPDLDFTRCLC